MSPCGYAGSYSGLHLLLILTWCSQLPYHTEGSMGCKHIYQAKYMYKNLYSCSFYNLARTPYTVYDMKDTLHYMQTCKPENSNYFIIYTHTHTHSPWLLRLWEVNNLTQMNNYPNLITFYTAPSQQFWVGNFL